jgi:hypothetical protein
MTKSTYVIARSETDPNSYEVIRHLCFWWHPFSIPCSGYPNSNINILCNPHMIILYAGLDTFWYEISCFLFRPNAACNTLDPFITSLSKFAQAGHVGKLSSDGSKYLFSSNGSHMHSRPFIPSRITTFKLQ